MNVLRAVVSWLSLYLVGLFFILSALTYGVAHVISADNLKQTLKEEGTYQKVVPAVLDIAAKEQGEGRAQGAGSEGDLPLNVPWVRSAVERAFPSSDIEQKGNTLIDGTFAWLEGETEKPQFQLDFSANKQKLAQELSKASESHLSTLPRCGRNNIGPSIDVYRAECLPVGVSPSFVANQIANDVAQDESVLKETVVTPENLDDATAATEEGSTSEATASENDSDPFENLQGLRDLYSNLGLFQWLLPVITLLLAALGAWMARDHRTAFKRLAFGFLSAGVGLMFLGVSVAFLLEKTVKTMSQEAIVNDVVSPVFINLSQQFRTIYLTFGVAAIVVAIILFIVRRKFFPANPTATKK